MSATRPPALALAARCLLALSATLFAPGCGAGSERAAAHPDFRALQVHEARVAELVGQAEDDAQPCDHRRAAADRCVAEVATTRRELENVADADADARVQSLSRLCAASLATVRGRCGET